MIAWFEKIKEFAYEIQNTFKNNTPVLYLKFPPKFPYNIPQDVINIDKTSHLVLVNNEIYCQDTPLNTHISCS